MLASNPYLMNAIGAKAVSSSVPNSTIPVAPGAVGQPTTGGSMGEISFGPVTGNTAPVYTPSNQGPSTAVAKPAAAAPAPTPAAKTSAPAPAPGGSSYSTTTKAGPLAYSGVDPTIADINYTPAEREARLVDAQQGTLKTMQGMEEQYRLMATRAGLDPSSGVAQGILRDMSRGVGEDLDQLRRSDYLQEIDARRRRDEMLANLRAELERTRVGSAASVQSAGIGAAAQRAAASMAASAANHAAELDWRYKSGMLDLEKQKAPFELLRMIEQPYATNFPSYEMSSGGQSLGSRIASGVGYGLDAYNIATGKKGS